LVAYSAERRTWVQRDIIAGNSCTVTEESIVVDFTVLPAGLPVPHDDGAADHLPGTPVPSLRLPTTDGGTADFSAFGPGRTVVYLYPLTGRPGMDLPEGWDDIPGAR